MKFNFNFLWLLISTGICTSNDEKSSGGGDEDDSDEAPMQITTKLAAPCLFHTLYDGSPNYFVAASLSFIKGSGCFFGTRFFFCFFRTMLIKTLGVALLLFCVCAYKMKSLRIYRSRAPVRGLLSTRNTFAALFTLAAAQRALAHESFIFGARVRELLLFPSSFFSVCFTISNFSSHSFSFFCFE